MITKDSDFVNSHLLHAKPAKLLLISTGNTSNRVLEQVVTAFISDIVREFQAHSFLELGQRGIIIRG